MKNIITIIFCFVAVSVFSQERDSAIHRYNTSRQSEWREVINPPAGVVDDSLIYTVKDGQKLMRNNKRTKLFDLQEAGIIADGVTDQTAKINNILSKSHVRGLNITYDFSGSELVITGVINTRGKIINFDGSVVMKGGGTLDNRPRINAAASIQIFDTSIKITNPITADGFTYPAWWGAKGDGVTNDLYPMRSLFRTQNIYIKFPRGRYPTTDSLVLHSTNSATMDDSAYIYSSVELKPTVIIGDANGFCAYKTYKFNIVKTLGNWADSVPLAPQSTTAILARNLYSCDIYLPYITGFTNAYASVGDNGWGFEHNRIYPGSLVANKRAFWFYGLYGGWVNSNHIKGGNITRHTGQNEALCAYGLVLGYGIGDTYAYNSNVWSDGASFQFKFNGKIFQFINSQKNSIVDFRNEANPIVIGEILGPNNIDNIIHANYDDNLDYKIDDRSSYGMTIYQSQRDRITQNDYVLLNWNAARNTTQYSATANSLTGGATIYDYDGLETVSAARAEMDIFSDHVLIKSFTTGIGGTYNSTLAKRYIIKRDFISNTSGRFFFKMYDSAFRQLPQTIKPKGTVALSWNNVMGGGWREDADGKGDGVLIVPEECKWVAIMIMRGSNDMRLRNLTIKTMHPSAGIAVKKTANNPLSETNLYFSSKPSTTGTYIQGTILYRYPFNKDSSSALGVEKSGTIRNLSGATGSIAAGGIKLRVTGISLDSVYIGEVLNVNNNIRTVAGKIGDTVVLNYFIASSYTGSINYNQPGFVELGKPAISGSGIPGTVGQVAIATGTNTFEGSNRLLATTGNALEVNSMNSISLAEFTENGISVHGSLPVRWKAAGANAGSVELALYREAANTMALRNGTNAQEFRVYKTYTNPEWFSVGYRIKANTITLGSYASGTGVVRDIEIAAPSTQINGKTKLLLTAPGAAGTDSILVKGSGGEVMAVSPSYYSTGGGGGLSGLTAGHVTYANSSSTITGDAGFTWNSTDKRLGITSTDAAKYSSVDWTNNAGDLAQMAMLGSSFNVGYFKGRRAVFNTGSAVGMAIAAYDAAGKIFFATGGTADANIRMVINPNGSISIGDTTKGVGFHINRSLHVNRDSLATTSTMTSKHLAVVNSSGTIEKIAVSDLGISVSSGAVQNISDANYTFLSTDYSVVVTNTTASRNINIPDASTNVNRVIFVRNAGSHSIFLNYSLIYNSTYGDGELKAGNWVTLQAKTGGWYVIANGNSSSHSGGSGSGDGFYEVAISNAINCVGWVNITDSTSFDYVGNSVHVYGSVNLSTITSTNTITSFEISLPIPTTFDSQDWMAGGSGWLEESDGEIYTVSIRPVVGTSRVKFSFKSGTSGVSNRKLGFNFSYKILQ